MRRPETERPKNCDCKKDIKHNIEKKKVDKQPTWSKIKRAILSLKAREMKDASLLFNRYCGIIPYSRENVSHLYL